MYPGYTYPLLKFLRLNAKKPKRIVYDTSETRSNMYTLQYLLDAILFFDMDLAKTGRHLCVGETTNNHEFGTGGQ